MLVGDCCLKVLSTQRSLYERFRQALCCDYLFDHLTEEELCVWNKERNS